jgi:hypothetical protein
MHLAQDAFARHFYYKEEGKRACTRYGLHSPLAIAFCFDTALEGRLGMLLERTKITLSGTAGENGVTEASFVAKAAELRAQWLEQRGSNEAAGFVSARAMKYAELARAGNTRLTGQITVNGNAVPGTDQCVSAAAENAGGENTETENNNNNNNVDSNVDGNVDGNNNAPGSMSQDSPQREAHIRADIQQETAMEPEAPAQQQTGNGAPY